MANVLITGTSAGIGLQTALVLGRAGHRVVATMRNLDRGAALRQIAESEALPISIVEMDVDLDGSVDAATEDIRRQFGPPDAIVNNAGIERAGAIETLSMDDFKATMETNYFGPVRTIRAWLPDMRRRRSGTIVNITSVAGKIACSPLAPYSASKYALEALSEALAQELKPFNIQVLIVQPGIIDTAMAHRIEDKSADETYPQVQRFAHMFQASLDHPTPPIVVAERIRNLIENGSDKLRHPVGPDAEGFLGWRSSLNDEQWVEWGALPDEAWYERVAREFGLDVAAKRGPVAASGVVAAQRGV